MTFEISAARIVMFSLSSNLVGAKAPQSTPLGGPVSPHLLGERIETGADRAIDLLAADAYNQTAKQFRIHAGLQLDGLASRAASLAERAES
jgi:hypothetical protein